MGSKAKAPAPNPEADYQQYLAEAQNALRVQKQVLPEMAALETAMAPQLAQAKMTGYETLATGMLGLADRLYEPSMAMQRQVAGGQLGLMAGLAPSATQAAIGGMDATTRGIYQTFGEQALADLQAGTGLSAQEQAFAQQSARAAAEARGVNLSRQGTDLEVLNTYRLGQQRLAQRQAVAAQAFQMGQGVQSVGMTGFLAPSLGMAQGYSVPGLMTSAGAGFTGLGESFLTPESQYLANIRANRIQMETSIQAANAQRSGAIFGGIASGLGAAAGGYLSKCWVAREVYGKDNPKWLVFRCWLEEEAPAWLHDLYVEEGERFAEFISDKPVFKAVIKAAMDLVIEPRTNRILA